MALGRNIVFLSKCFSNLTLLRQNKLSCLQRQLTLASSSSSNAVSGGRNLDAGNVPDGNDVSLAVSTATIRPPLPLIVGRQLAYPPKFTVPRQAWVENFDTAEEVKLGIIDLHPRVFASPPRLDLLHQNVRWQQNYRRVRFAKTKTRAEVRGGYRKPWPQKGTGRARHGSIRSPLFRGGGVVHGPRGAKSYFYMLPFWVRVYGLTTALSVKLAQDDLHIVDSLDIPTDDPKFLEGLAEARNWGLSILFIDDSDIMPKNITLATDNINHYNLMPVYGLNVYSMLKHDTLVLTTAAVERIEERILFQLNRLDTRCTKAFNRMHLY